MTEQAAPAPAAPSTPSAPASSSAPSQPSTPTAAPAAPRARLTSAQMKARLDSPSSFESAVAEEISDPAMPDLPDMGIDSEPEVSEPELPEAVESDDPFAAYRDADIHGMKALDILEAIKNGKLPDALMDKLLLDLKDGDHSWQDTVAAARNGAMMQRKFTQNQQKLAEERRAYESERDGFNSEREEFIGYLRQWKEDPRKLRAGLMKLGMPFQDAAIIEAEEYGQIKAMREKEAAGDVPAGTTDRLIRAQEAEAELEAARLRQARYEAQQAQREQQAQQMTRAEKDQATAKTVANQAVQLFERIGVKRGTGEWNYFKQVLQQVWSPGDDLPSATELEAAVRETKRWADERRAELQENKPAPTTPKLGKTSLDGGAPTRATPGARPARLSSAQAKAKYLK